MSLRWNSNVQLELERRSGARTGIADRAPVQEDGWGQPTMSLYASNGHRNLRRSDGRKVLACEFALVIAAFLLMVWR